MIRSRPRYVLCAISFVLLTLTGCIAFVDFSGFDTTPPEAPPTFVEGGTTTVTVAADYELTLPTEAHIVQGGTADIPVKLTCKGDFAGSVDISTPSPLPNVSVESQSVSCGQEGALRLRSSDTAASATAGLSYTLQLVGRSAGDGGDGTSKAVAIKIIVDGAPGAFDQTYGAGSADGGFVTTGFASNAYLVEVFSSDAGAATVVTVEPTLESDGGIAGYDILASARHDASGKPDATYGTAGVFRTKLLSAGGLHDAAWSPDDESIYVASTSTDRLSLQVARITSAGTLDPAFGNNGQLVLAKAKAVKRVRLLPNANGVFVVACDADSVSIAAFDKAGKTRNSYGTSGVDSFLVQQPDPLSGAVYLMLDAQLDGQGRVLVMQGVQGIILQGLGGYDPVCQQVGGDYYWTVTRRLPNGGADPSWKSALTKESPVLNQFSVLGCYGGELFIYGDDAIAQPTHGPLRRLSATGASSTISLDRSAGEQISSDENGLLYYASVVPGNSFLTTGKASVKRILASGAGDTSFLPFALDGLQRIRTAMAPRRSIVVATGSESRIELARVHR